MADAFDEFLSYAINDTVNNGDSIPDCEQHEWQTVTMCRICGLALYPTDTEGKQ